MTLAPAKVPQHLELEDVVAWGCSATDLLFVLAGALVAWWLYLAVPDPFAARVAVAATPLAAGVALGLLRLGGRPLRGWIGLGIAFASRERVLVTGGPE